MQLFLVRNVFCLFADDTRIFEPRAIFLQFVEDRTKLDGTDVGLWLSRRFQVLLTPFDDRPLGEDLSRFSHVNVGLFADQRHFADFNSEMMAVLDAGTESEGIQSQTSAKPRLRPKAGVSCGQMPAGGTGLMPVPPVQCQRISFGRAAVAGRPRCSPKGCLRQRTQSPDC